MIMLCLCFLIVYLPLRLFAQDDIRLAADGRLEVLYNGQWGTVCNDLFGDRDAVVACRQLGYKGGISIGNSVNDGSGKIWLDNLRCKGSEGMLAECRRNDWGIHDCTHPEDVGIRCDSIDRVTEGGLWGNWLSWSVCSTSCGAGIQKRQRNCDSPPPYLGGGYCSGLPLESRSCNNMCCPSTWSEWSICPVSCGGGIQHRLRDCHIQSSIWNDTFCDASRENRLCNNTCCSAMPLSLYCPLMSLDMIGRVCYKRKAIKELPNIYSTIPENNGQ